MDILEFLSKNKKICIIGLGYVGLPLAALMARKYQIVGFDINSTRISELKAGEDKTNEVSSEMLKSAGIEFTDDAKMISKCSLIIVAVPTPIDKFKKPDLTSVEKATETIGKNLTKNMVIVYESTVYPGVTEDICIPILEKESGLSWKKDFHVGYHPQVILAGRRINDNMGKHVAENTVKNLIQAGNRVQGCKVLILGLTFKENIGDLRNTKVVDVYNELKEYGIDVYVHDPYVLKDEVKKAYGIDMFPGIENNAPYDAVIIAVNHKQYLEELNYERMIELMGGKNPILIDVKGIFNKKEAEDKGFLYWRL